MIRTTVKGPYTARQILERPNLHKRLMQLTNGGFGRGASTLYPMLTHLTFKSKDKFWLAWHEGEVVGWIWMEKPQVRTFYTMASGLKRFKVSTIGAFVHRRYRKNGIGKKLTARLNADVNPSIKFIEEAWNNAGRNLYESISNRTEWNYCTGMRLV